MAYLETDKSYARTTDVVEPVEPHWTPYESEKVLEQRTRMARNMWQTFGRV